MSSLRRYIASVFLIRWPKLRRKVLVLKLSSGYIKAFFASDMCFDVNTTFVNWPSFIHHTLLRLLTLWQPDADVSSFVKRFHNLPQLGQFTKHCIVWQFIKLSFYKLYRFLVLHNVPVLQSRCFKITKVSKLSKRYVSNVHYMSHCTLHCHVISE